MIISQANKRLPDVTSWNHFIIYKDNTSPGNSIKRAQWRSFLTRHKGYYNFTLELIK